MTRKSRDAMRQTIQQQMWWIGMLVVLLPLLFILPAQDNHLVPVGAYYGTTSIWNIVDKMFRGV